MRFNFGKFGGFDGESGGQEISDFVLVTGDAYVDHPSYGAAIIGRLLENDGYSVAVIAQPDWNDTESFKVFGCPRLAFLVTSGNVDSMVSNYTVARKKREKDLYSPAGKQGYRPDRAAIVYSNKIRQAYKTVPVILGGLEASLRRFAHYDYWDDKLRRSILMDSGADMLVYGMGESQITAIAAALRDGIAVSDITFVKGTAYKTKDISQLENYTALPSFDSVKASKKSFAESFMIQFENTDHITGKVLVEDYSGVYIVQQSPAAPLERSELDKVYSLPFTRNYHPVYESAGGVPAIQEVKFSIVSSRGCFGGCSFCALGYHQGRAVRSRSHDSIVKEAEDITGASDFKGYIHDVGGPTANFRNPSCKKQLKSGVCPKRQCLFPKPCEQMDIDHSDYLTLLRKLRSLPRIKKVFIRSGLRYDYLISDKNQEFFNELCKYHVSGQLKVAPEHISQKVLEKMGKPSRDVYDRFVKKYYEINNKLGMEQYLVPYLMSSHPGSDLTAAVELAEYLRDMGYMPEQVQDFYPTPGTLSTCMYYTGLDPRDMSPVYVPKTPQEKAQQRALIQYRLPQNYELVRSALVKAGREDLIGYGAKCLIRPRGYSGKPKPSKGNSSTHPKEKPGKSVPKKKKTIRNIHKPHK